MTACTVWTGSLNRRGYPVLPGNRQRATGHTLAHRHAYEQAHGPIPEGHHVHHTCGTLACVNPDHLEALSPAEHAARHDRSVPDEDAVIRLREEGLSYRQIGAALGIHFTTVGLVLRRAKGRAAHHGKPGQSH